jgi:hypothetical protein
MSKRSWHAAKLASIDRRHRSLDGGYVAIALGILAAVALGVGLMARMFFSNRSGRD